eukprot:TRINITY_DN42074_c0_g1_i1.p1 TRINITY_DN42074_c0_g1~~TRINITY_DN42074_c0_g1_i1.p1  ORF type:complete len:319 (-),score=67.38 TRINITY_DN42074_c0_g1_i1:85-1041(-)
MAWAIFAYTILPSGGLLVALLVSGFEWAMRCSKIILSSPVRIGNLTISLAVLVTALCACVSAIQYSCLRRSESLVEEARSSGVPLASGMVDQQVKSTFHHGRNFYMSLLGLVLWSVSWRLSVLYENRQLVPQGSRSIQKSLGSRCFWMLLGFLALLVADVPLCRLNYQLQLATSVTPKKMRLGSMAAKCENVWASNAQGECAEFCNAARSISEDRHHVIMWVRNWHLLGRVAAELFDGARAMEQGPKRIQELFEKKSCSKVLASVDKSNELVNGICIAAAGVSIIGCFVAFSQAFAGDKSSGVSGDTSSGVSNEKKGK